MMMAKKLASDAAKMGVQPFPDPDDREQLFYNMDKEHQIITGLLEKKKLIDAEIAAEQSGSDTQPTADKPADLPTLPHDQPEGSGSGIPVNHEAEKTDPR